MMVTRLKKKRWKIISKMSFVCHFALRRNRIDRGKKPDGTITLKNSKNEQKNIRKSLRRCES